MMAAQELVLLLVSFRSLMCCVYSGQLGGVVVELGSLDRELLAARCWCR